MKETVFNRTLASLILRYGLLLGTATVLFVWLRNILVFNYQSIEAYSIAIAALFAAAGVGIGLAVRKPIIKPIPEIPMPTVGSMAPHTLLSKREMEVLLLLAKNRTNQQIADELCIELSTLKTHINRIYKKLEVKTRRDLHCRFPELADFQ